MTRRLITVERLALLGTVLFVVFLISRYDLCFQDGEVYGYDTAAVINGTGFSMKDVATAFHVMELEGDIRPRFVSYFAFIVTTKTRLALWNVVPPHPSFSPVWLLTLFLSPVLLFKFLELELSERAAAIAGVAVYLVSTGFLSGVTMLFHPAKPLTNVLVLAVFYLSARIRRASPSAVPAGSYATLLALLTLAPFVDETAVFAYAIPLVWCQELRRKWPTYVPAAASAVVIFGILPAFPGVVGTDHFRVAGYLLRMVRSGLEYGGWRFDLHHFAWNAGNLLIPGLLPWRVAHAAVPVEASLALPIAALIGLAAVSAVLTSAALQNHLRWLVYRKLMVLAAGYIAFQTFVFMFHPLQLVATGFYYGAIFSVIFASLAAVLYAAIRQWARFGEWLAPAALLWVVTISAVNFMTIDASWMQHSNDKTLVELEGTPGYHTTGDWGAIDSLKAKVDIAHVTLPRSGPAAGVRSDLAYAHDDARRPAPQTFANVMAIWRSWREGRADFAAGRPVTLRNLWLVAELSLENERRR